MRTCIGLGIGVGLLLMVGSAAAQPRAASGRQVQTPRQAPTVPLQPARQQPPAPRSQPPFVLTPPQQAEVDRILLAWERHSEDIKTFQCKFTRREYDPVWGPPNDPKFVDEGMIKYATPDKGLFLVEGKRAEKWICDGKSIYAYDFQQKKLTQHKLPPEMQGKAIADGPLPFLFGAKAERLKQRYLIRIITPPGAENEVWLEAYPRYQQDAANFKRAELILATNDMRPIGLQIHLPNGKCRTSYHFENIVLNDPLRFFKGDPFRAYTPFGWKKVVEEPPPQQASRKPASGDRR